MFDPRPKPRKELIAFERLAFDPRLQMRDLPDGLLFDDDTATAYAERMEDGDFFPPLEVVLEVRKGKEPVYWVFAGFTRGGAHALRGTNSVECLVYPGTFADALFYALSENRKHGHPSSHGDKTKAVRALMESPDLMKRVREAAKGSGGIGRAMAVACGVSYALVTKTLAASGFAIESGELKKSPRKTVDTSVQKEKRVSEGDGTESESKRSPAPSPTVPEPVPVEPEPAARAPYVAPEQHRLADLADALRAALETFAGLPGSASLLTATTTGGALLLTDITGTFMAAVGEGQHRERGGRRTGEKLALAQSVDPVAGAERMVHCRWLKDLASALRSVR